jgi:hypothetical protein
MGEGEGSEIGIFLYKNVKYMKDWKVGVENTCEEEKIRWLKTGNNN